MDSNINLLVENFAVKSRDITFVRSKTQLSIKSIRFKYDFFFSSFAYMFVQKLCGTMYYNITLFILIHLLYSQPIHFGNFALSRTNIYMKFLCSKRNFKVLTKRVQLKMFSNFTGFFFRKSRISCTCQYFCFFTFSNIAGIYRVQVKSYSPFNNKFLLLGHDFVKRYELY